jgi:hypothetical protein
VLLAAQMACFVVAAEAKSIVPCGVITLVPGAPHPAIGITLVDAEVVPVVRLAAGASTLLLLCARNVQRLALVGFDVVRTGWFELAPNAYPEQPAVLFNGQVIAQLALADLFAKLASTTSLATPVAEHLR